MDSNKINKLYNIEFEWGMSLTTRDLYSVGLNVDDILELINNKYLIRLKKDIYKYDFYKLYEYADLCIRKKDYNVGIKYLNICLLMQYKNKEVLKKLFHLYLKKKDVYNGCYYFYRLIDSKESISDIDIVMLCILSKVVSLPEIFNKYIININKDELVKNINIDNCDRELIIDLINLVNNKQYGEDKLTLCLIKKQIK